ncbi:LysR family transcriptional regulator [Cryobacterium sp. TMT1-21]|uniref:LysR family transcriptional regulator n=1 Tax=Cryobacterium shii TaxID=1259235 RepID=A0AAQ2C7X9_9MICO|nr:MULTISPECIES: LysR substrate-binding domain-containing protein [Cryobacterium]TFC51307.1 LysR family transcriptional regulator [Cryobacterium shii]TFC83745.1 LysR family transcriptional regulator [Cryobacterium sp. TmT2-59]TFD15358.1 LysR family transcriptional regulator [Cryobacterium sp. TMT1-21]TFD20573.1 LysR family transcriptional regulator [Cryobacterium sp. TMT4-10]TFD20746.1 LysR family transcriptional regulator [Cryobacterium sp. TMT2-23]
MDVRQFEFFSAVAGELSFTRAAERLTIAQSAVSAGVRALEGELGVELFDRSRRQIRLTSTGELLLPKVRDALDAVNEVRDVAQETTRAITGSIVIGLMTSVTLVNVPRLLGHFRTGHRGVDVRLRAARRGSAGLVDELVSGELDLAFLALSGPAPAPLIAVRIASSPMVLVVPDGHRLASARTVTLDDLVAEEFIDLPPGYASRQIVDDAFAAAGIERRITIEVSDIGTAAEYVTNGLGVALLPEFAANDAPGVRRLPVDNVPEFTVYLAASRKRRASAAVRAFVDLALPREEPEIRL